MGEAARKSTVDDGLDLFFAMNRGLPQSDEVECVPFLFEIWFPMVYAARVSVFVVVVYVRVRGIALLITFTVVKVSISRSKQFLVSPPFVTQLVFAPYRIEGVGKCLISRRKRVSTLRHATIL